MSLALTLSVLAVPLILGILAGAARLFPEPDAAIGALNRFVLYLAFPTLIVVGMVDRDFTVPTNPAFYVVIPAIALAMVALIAIARPWLRGKAGAIVLTTLFGNTAYVGLPVVEGVLGPEALGVGALAVAIHVTTSMIVGPALLLTWSENGDGSGALRRALQKVVRQPLAWAPIVGFALRLAPPEVLGLGSSLFAPIGKTASPVGLFLIGLFIHTHGRALSFDALLPVQIMAKLLALPAVTAAVVLGCQQLEWLTTTEGAVLILLSAMPTAISTFALAREFETDTEQVTVAVVATTLASALVIPLVAGWMSP
ncbi:MAG: AEC family transporter [Proteobacteria bacterium]|nr:AEC family transporter [Pseudomonadota bacterium]